MHRSGFDQSSEPVGLQRCWTHGRAPWPLRAVGLHEPEASGPPTIHWRVEKFKSKVTLASQHMDIWQNVHVLFTWCVPQHIDGAQQYSCAPGDAQKNPPSFGLFLNHGRFMESSHVLAGGGDVNFASRRNFFDTEHALLAQQADNLDPAVITQSSRHPGPATVVGSHSPV